MVSYIEFWVVVHLYNSITNVFPLYSFQDILGELSTVGSTINDRTQGAHCVMLTLQLERYFELLKLQWLLEIFQRQKFGPL